MSGMQYSSLHPAESPINLHQPSQAISGEKKKLNHATAHLPSSQGLGTIHSPFDQQTCHTTFPFTEISSIIISANKPTLSSSAPPPSSSKPLFLPWSQSFTEVIIPILFGSINHASLVRATIPWLHFIRPIISFIFYFHSLFWEELWMN